MTISLDHIQQIADLLSTICGVCGFLCGAIIWLYARWEQHKKSKKPKKRKKRGQSAKRALSQQNEPHIHLTYQTIVLVLPNDLEPER